MTRRPTTLLITTLLLLPVLATAAQDTPPETPAPATAAIEDSEAAGPAAETTDAPRLDWPQPDVGVDALEARAAAQRWLRDELEVPHDFAFTDRRAASGITFLHRIPEEGKKHWMPVHYDHGSPVIAGDVSGDGRSDLYFVNLVGDNALWRNRGDGTFEDVTDRAGVAVPGRVSMAASFADADNDGDPDLFVTTIRLGNLLFVNDGSGRFTEVAAKAGLDHRAHSSTGTFLDVDRDGLLDLLVTNVGRFTTDEKRSTGAFQGVPDAFQGHLHPDRAERHLLYRNLGDLRFTEISEQVGFVDATWSGDASATDFDGDLDPDVYLTNMQGDDRYWENRGGERFVERTAEHFPKSPWGTMGIKFFDFDNDGDLDLLLTDMHSDMSQEVPPSEEERKSEMLWPDDELQGGADNIFGNAFWRNLGDGEFEEVSDALGLENYWPWGVSVADLNADGFQDAFITASMSYPFRYGINSLLLNNRAAGFADAEFLLGVEPREEFKVPWFELDCGGVTADGEPRPGADRAHPMCATRSGRWTVYGNLGTRGAVILDLEGDGDLDVVTNEFNAHPQVLVSDLAQRGPVRWLAVDLVGTRSNRDGLGAWVRLVAGDATYTRYHDGKSGYMAQSSLPLYFGLGKAESVDRIEVRWPSGAVQTVTDGLEINRTVEISEPAAEPEVEAPPEASPSPPSGG